ncbi:Uncharacterised protein [Mycobacteroides abscessus subsp. abscessus]|nr:Uncharacterised protein [Mycobacteroides abscessus subsp. abscessus]
MPMAWRAGISPMTVRMGRSQSVMVVHACCERSTDFSTTVSGAEPRMSAPLKSSCSVGPPCPSRAAAKASIVATVWCRLRLNSEQPAPVEK